MNKYLVDCAKWTFCEISGHSDMCTCGTCFAACRAFVEICSDVQDGGMSHGAALFRRMCRPKAKGVECSDNCPSLRKGASWCGASGYCMLWEIDIHGYPDDKNAYVRCARCMAVTISIGS